LPIWDRIRPAKDTIKVMLNSSRAVRASTTAPIMRAIPPKVRIVPKALLRRIIRSLT